MKAEQPYIKKIILLVKFALLPITFGFIAYKLLYSYDIDTLIKGIKFVWGPKSYLLIATTTVLMLLNWTLESIKWKMLVQRSEPITFMEALKGVLSGVAFNMITPNQLGDFLGRVIHLKKLDKIRGTLVTVIGHTAQVIMTAAFGLTVLIWFLLQKEIITNHSADSLYIVLFILTVISLIAYVNIGYLSRLTINFKVKKYLDIFNLYTRVELMEVLLISLVRYVIFVAQYYCLLLLFDVDVTMTQGIACIIGTLCAQSFVPSFILIEIGMRGASALWFFSMFTAEITPVLLTAYSLWIINLMLPGLLGLVYILRWRQAK